MTFMEVDFCRRMGQLRLMYSMTLTFIFKIKYFLVLHLLKNCAGSGYPQQIFLSSNGPIRGVALVYISMVIKLISGRFFVALMPFTP